MAGSSTSTHSPKLTPKQRTLVRTVLATGATLMMLISAQLFASGAAGSTDSTANVTTTTASAVIVPTIQPTTATVSAESGDTSAITLTSNQSGTIFNTQTQPIPGTHSSK